jgi:hypothetical protein
VTIGIGAVAIAGDIWRWLKSRPRAEVDTISY